MFFCLVSSIHSLFGYFTVYEVDTYNNFQDDQGNKLCIGELKYIFKKGKQALSFVNNVPARDEKSVLSLVVRLLLEHSNVPKEKSCIEVLLMKDIKKSSKDKRIYANSIEKVNASFAKKNVNFIAMSLLFDVFIYHNAQAAPAPWADRHLSLKDKICSNKIKLFYSSFASIRMRIKPGSCLVKGNSVLLDGQCLT
jgi:hypothetical protein